MGLNLTPESIHTFREEGRYSYQFLDSPVPERLKSKYSQPIDIASLQTPDMQRKKLLDFPSMFGTSRLKLKDAKSRAIVQLIRETFTLANEAVKLVAEKIVTELGVKSRYLAVHCRLGDGSFKVRYFAYLAECI